MIVNNSSLIDDLVGWWQARRSLPPVIRVGTRVEPSLTGGLTPRDTPDRVPDTAQTDYDTSQALPDPMWFRNDPEPPRPRRKRSARNEQAAKWIREQVRKNGGVPAFTVIRGELGLPKATASRLRKEAIAEFGLVA